MKLPALKRYELLWISLAYLGCAALLTLPFLSHPTSLFGEADAWQFLWNFDHVRNFVAGSDDLFSTQMLHWPVGISLVFHTLSLSNAVPALVLMPLFGLVGTYNVIIYLHFVGSGLAMYILARHLVRSRFAAFFAGYLFTFSAYHFMRAGGHLNLFSLEGIPLYIYFLYRLREKPHWTWASGAMIAMVYSGYADLQYVMYLFLFTLVFLVYAALRKSPLRFYAYLAAVGAVGTLLLLPYLVPLVVQKFTTTDHDVFGHDPLMYSADVQSFFIPGVHSAYRWSTDGYWNRWTRSMESPTYIGYVTLILAAVTLYRRWRDPDVRFWAVVAGGFLVLSLGPYLHIGGVIYRSVPLPYLIIAKIPLLSIGGVVARFSLIGIMALIVLASASLSSLRFAHRKGLLACTAVLVVAAFELLPWPVPVSAVTVPAFYRTLAADSEQYAIADVSDAPAKVLFYQTVHHKPLVGGYTSRPTVPTQNFLRDTPVLSDLYSETPLAKTAKPPVGGVDTLRELQIKYILIPSDSQPLQLYMAQTRLPVVLTSDGITVFRVY